MLLLLGHNFVWFLGGEGARKHQQCPRLDDAGWHAADVGQSPSSFLFQPLCVLQLHCVSCLPADVYVYPGSGATHDTLHDKQQQVVKQEQEQQQKQQPGQQGSAPGAPSTANNGPTTSSSARPTAAGAGGFEAPEQGVKPVVGSGGDATVHPAPAAAAKVEGKGQVRVLRWPCCWSCEHTLTAVTPEGVCLWCNSLPPAGGEAVCLPWSGPACPPGQGGVAEGPPATLTTALQCQL
jgi:hypothetical protein